MKAPIKIIATVLATSVATSSMAAPASAFFFRGPHHHHHHFFHHKKKVVSHGGSNTGAYIVGCLAGSALGLIGASAVKGGGLRWMSQKEFETTPRNKANDLTIEEAQAIAFTCGLATPWVIANFKKAAPAVVKAKY